MELTLSEQITLFLERVSNLTNTEPVIGAFKHMQCIFKTRYMQIAPKPHWGPIHVTHPFPLRLSTNIIYNRPGHPEFLTSRPIAICFDSVNKISGLLPFLDLGNVSRLSRYISHKLPTCVAKSLYRSISHMHPPSRSQIERL